MFHLSDSSQGYLFHCGLFELCRLGTAYNEYLCRLHTAHHYSACTTCSNYTVYKRIATPRRLKMNSTGQLDSRKCLLFTGTHKTVAFLINFWFLGAKL